MKLTDVRSLIGEEVRFTLPQYKPKMFEDGVIRNSYVRDIQYHGRFKEVLKDTSHWWVLFQDFEKGEVEISKSRVSHITQVEVIRRKKSREPKIRGGNND